MALTVKQTALVITGDPAGMLPRTFAASSRISLRAASHNWAEENGT
jgi:hypothetical protein